jgi:hypothetical protein
MIFVIGTKDDVEGLDITRALSLAGIEHVILSKQNNSVYSDPGGCPGCGSPYKDVHWPGCEYERVE